MVKRPAHIPWNGSGNGRSISPTFAAALPSVLAYIDSTWKKKDQLPTPDTNMPESAPASAAPKRIIAGADHGGWKLKDALVSHLRSKGFTVEDAGTNNGDRVDYP